MILNKLSTLAFTFFVGLTLTGCIAAEDEVLVDEAGGEDESAIAEVGQALDTCTTTGGGTWGKVITLCKTPGNSLYVKKISGSFTSSGTMKLKTWLGTIQTLPVFVGQSTVYFGPQLPGWYSVIYESNAPGTAYTGEIQVK